MRQWDDKRGESTKKLYIGRARGNARGRRGRHGRHTVYNITTFHILVQWSHQENFDQQMFVMKFFVKTFFVMKIFCHGKFFVMEIFSHENFLS